LSPATSISVHVDTQAEVDRLWSALLEGGGSESRCGWLTDRFGLSWQIIPRALPRLLQSDTSGRVMQAMMGMVKLDIAALEAAAQGG
jgi:predicted 3-demethylubiquinone-9 3-methyltransferase (glyoxalase superfamily)